MKFTLHLTAVGALLLCLPLVSSAQQASPSGSAAAEQGNVPAAVQRAEDKVEEIARRYRFGVQGGVGLDPELVNVGVHAVIGPLFRQNIMFRPGVELGLGEITTLVAVNLDVLYSFDRSNRRTEWSPYLGAGPSFGLSHRGFGTDEADHVDVEGVDSAVTDKQGRFDFSDTDFNGGMNFIVGMRKHNGMFFEMKATAWGASNIRLLAGINF